jgi:dihydrofolate reductase
MRISLIAALDRRFAIGRDNQLPWRLPDDLKRFKALTLHKPVLMGRKTALSLGRALPDRRNLVLTRLGKVPFEGMEAVASLEEAVDLARQSEALEMCVIGGGEIYELCLPRADSMHLTFVDTDVEGADAFFPRFDASQWAVTARESHVRDARHPYAFEFVDYFRDRFDEEEDADVVPSAGGR